MGATALNAYQLGLSYPSATQPTNILGGRHEFLDADYLLPETQRVVASNRRIVTRLVQNNSGGALSAGTIVTWDANNVGTAVGAVTGAGGVGAGIVDPFLTTTVPNGDYFHLVVEGPCFCIASGAVAVNTRVIPAASGRYAATTVSAADVNATFGRSITASGAAGDRRKLLVNFTA